MFTRYFSPELSVSEQLNQLSHLRLFYLFCEFFVIGICQFYFKFELPWVMLWPQVLLHVLTSSTFYFLSRRGRALSSLVIFYSILLDILLFGGLLYFSGGVTNGAVSILLIPVATGAALLSWRRALLVAVFACAVYSSLMFYSWPAAQNVHMHHGAQSFSTHLIGMWLTFILSCLLLVWFIGAQSERVKHKQQKLSALRESQLRDEQLIAIATFAANAAHDLATPLSSIGLLCDELKDEPGKAGLDTLIEQVNECRQIVQNISHQAILNKADSKQRRIVYEYLDKLCERWLVTRPDIVMHKIIDKGLTHAHFTPDAALQSALINILDNAADASLDNGSDQLHLTVTINAGFICIQITDKGAGIDAKYIESLGKEPVESDSGLGLGQFLANATIGRFGGNVWRSSNSYGTQTLVRLPLGDIDDK